MVRDESCVPETDSLLEAGFQVVGCRFGVACRKASRRQFADCVVSHVLERHAVPETGQAVVRVLERLGHTVECPAGQTCWQTRWNTRYQAEALPMVARSAGGWGAGAGSGFGAFRAIRGASPELPDVTFVRMSRRGMRENSRKLVAELLTRHPQDKRILIAAATDRRRALTMLDTKTCDTKTSDTKTAAPLNFLEVRHSVSVRT